MRLPALFLTLSAALLVTGARSAETAANSPAPERAAASTFSDGGYCENQCWYAYTQCRSDSPYTDCTSPYNECVAYCRSYSSKSNPVKPPSFAELMKAKGK